MREPGIQCAEHGEHLCSLRSCHARHVLGGDGHPREARVVHVCDRMPADTSFDEPMKTNILRVNGARRENSLVEMCPKRLHHRTIVVQYLQIGMADGSQIDGREEPVDFFGFQRCVIQSTPGGEQIITTVQVCSTCSNRRVMLKGVDAPGRFPCGVRSGNIPGRQIMTRKTTLRDAP